MAKKKILLTDVQAAVLSFIVAYQKANKGQSPTLREIGENCGGFTACRAGQVLQCLEKRGAIRSTRDWGRKRIEIL